MQTSLNGIRGFDVDPESLTQTDLLPDQLWGQGCIAFNIQTDLDAGTALAAARIGSALAAAFPGQFLVPEEALHVSVLNLVHSRSAEPDVAKEAAWKRNGSRWLNAAEKICRDTEPFAIPFGHVVPTPSGIVIASPESTAMLVLRRRLADALGINAAIPELTHVTVLRFGPEPPDIHQVRRAIRQLDIATSCAVRRLRLVREVVYPSLERRSLGCFELTGSGRGTEPRRAILSEQKQAPRIDDPAIPKPTGNPRWRSPCADTAPAGVIERDGHQ